MEEKKKIVTRVEKEKVKVGDRKERKRRELKGRCTHLTDSHATWFIIHH